MDASSPDSEILRSIRMAFADCPRPEHFTDHSHCEECREHDEVLRANDLDTLTLEHLGQSGWDPICFISPVGFAYYFPALARLALRSENDKGEWYLPQLLFHLRSDGVRNERWQQCSTRQRAEVVGFLEHVIESRAEQLDLEMEADNAMQALAAWTSSEASTGQT